MESARPVKLFRNGRNQAVRIPREFELPGEDAVIRREGDQLIIEPLRRNQNLLDLLAKWAAEPPLTGDERLPLIPQETPRPFDL